MLDLPKTKIMIWHKEYKKNFYHLSVTPGGP